jgi:hypothetical protein
MGDTKIVGDGTFLRAVKEKFQCQRTFLGPEKEYARKLPH